MKPSVGNTFLFLFAPCSFLIFVCFPETSNCQKFEPIYSFTIQALELVLLHPPQNEAMHFSSRTCYSLRSPIQTSENQHLLNYYHVVLLPCIRRGPL
uniref:Secreted protein n=1 Tax=Cyanistes caeruleus TaxID=156563 RepID=A0A8C0VL53_CYACU